jgi:hypothetical protein
MDHNEIATKLADFGRREARLMRKLAKVQAQRCSLLSEVAKHAGLQPDVMAQSVAPKDDR